MHLVMVTTVSTTNQTNADTSNDEFTLAGNVLTLGTRSPVNFNIEAGSDQAGAYFCRITYTDLGWKYLRSGYCIQLYCCNKPITATVSLVSTDQTKDGVTQSTEVTGGKSTIQVNETQKATIKSTGGNTVLSGELTTFMNSHASGSWSLGWN